MVFSGSVVSGIQADKGGIKTANLLVDCPVGFYSVQTNFGPGLAVSLPSNPGVLEVHIIGFDRDIYGQTLRVEICNRMDGELLRFVAEGVSK